MAKSKTQKQEPTNDNQVSESESEETTERAPIDRWDTRQVKNALDDSIKTAFKTSFPDCQEDYSLIDKRLILCTICCVLCGIACFYDYTFPYPKSHDVLIACIIPYAITFGCLTYFMLYVEGTILASYKIGKDAWNISTQLEKYSSDYILELFKNGHKCESTISIGDLITEDNIVLDDKVQARVSKLVKRVNSGKIESKSPEGKKTK